MLELLEEYATEWEKVKPQQVIWLGVHAAGLSSSDKNTAQLYSSIAK